MVTEIRVYIEGGGDSRDTKAFLRQGFSLFLGDLIRLARNRRIRWQTITCGSRQAAFDAFKRALIQHASSFNVLLVDSEGPVATAPWHHLRQRDGWIADDLSNDHCHLMTQAMEAWFVADMESLARYYGAGFHATRIPRVADVEQIPKDQLEPILRDATRDTQKGEYHKIRHAFKLLEILDVGVVRGASRHCERLFAALTAKIENN
jgi:hypothetical protein